MVLRVPHLCAGPEPAEGHLVAGQTDARYAWIHSGRPGPPPDEFLRQCPDGDLKIVIKLSAPACRGLREALWPGGGSCDEEGDVVGVVSCHAGEEFVAEGVEVFAGEGGGVLS